MSEFTPDRLAEMRAVAVAATRGPWSATEPRAWGDDDTLQSAVMVAGGETLTWDDHGGEVFHPADATFIATFDPPTMLSLIATLEGLSTTNENLVAYARKAEAALEADDDRVARHPET